ncbi:MAG TPA: MarR family transcriptional regulator [Allosphingosinicella sp.]
MDETDLRDLSTRLHAASIRLLRTLRQEDDGSGLSAPRLSALSVIVFGGPTALAELAAAEQVKPPTMSRIVDALVQAGLVTREAEPRDRRSVRIAATEQGRAVMEAGRQRRLRSLLARLETLEASEQRLLSAALDPLEKLVR